MTWRKSVQNNLLSLKKIALKYWNESGLLGILIKIKQLFDFWIPKRLTAVIISITYLTLISLFLISFSYNYVFGSASKFFSISSIFFPSNPNTFFLSLLLGCFHFSYSLCVSKFSKPLHFYFSVSICLSTSMNGLR